MKKFTNKFLAILMCLTMILTIAPLSGIVPLVSAATYSGICGTNLTWTFDTLTGVLDITGEGDMYNYFYEEELGETNVPWKLFRIDIKSVIIGDSVTSIGNSAFYFCGSLTSITIPASVTSIGNSAFYHCYSLTSITIGNSVTSIGNSAFGYCTSLTSITIPDSVTSIGDRAFLNCNRLTNIIVDENNRYYSNDEHGVLFNKDKTELIQYPAGNTNTSYTIPDSVTSIGDRAFLNCNRLTNIIVDENNRYYSNDEYGVLFNKDKTTLIQYPVGNKRTSYTIPDSVTSIGDSAFEDCYNLTSITIGNSVTSIGNYAFRNCDSLTSITIPDSVTSMGNYAFAGCYNLTSVTIGNSVTIIGNYAFAECYDLTSVTIGNSVTSIGDSAFFYSGLTSITIPDSVTSIGDSAFRYCQSLTSITIPDSVTSIGNSAFYSCYSLTSITIPDSVTSIGEGPFAACTDLTSIIVDPDNGYYLNDSYGVLFNKDKTELIQYPAGNTNTSYTIPDSVTSIGDYAFYECYNLTSVVIGNSVTSIGYQAFRSCTDLTSITIPDSVTSIGSYAFYDCISLGDVYYNGSKADWEKISIGDYNSNLTSNLRYKFESGTCGDNLTWRFNSDTGVLDISGEGDMTKWLSYSSVPWDPYSSYIKTIIIGDNVTSIGEFAFYNCYRLTDVTLGNNVTRIGDNAFKDCYSLTSITIPDSVESVGARAFENCYLTDIVIGKSVKSIGDFAFAGCYLLENVFYSGGKDDWNKIDIGIVNSILTNARIHYNSSSAHSYFERIVEPTCTQDGYKLCVCECDNVYIEEHIDALGHSYKNGVCINCGKTAGGISVPDNSSVVIDKEKGLISGLDMSLDKDGLMQYLEISDDVTLTLSTDIIGTGTVITISDKATGNILETYTAVIFGDYNGDGVADIEDTGYFSSISNFEIFDYFEYEYLFMAADINGDGVVDSMDEEDMYAVANYDAYIDFTITSGSKVIRY